MDTSFYKIYRILIRILTTNRMASRISFQAGPRLSDPRKFNGPPSRSIFALEEHYITILDGTKKKKGNANFGIEHLNRLAFANMLGYGGGQKVGLDNLSLGCPEQELRFRRKEIEGLSPSTLPGPIFPQTRRKRICHWLIYYAMLFRVGRNIQICILTCRPNNPFTLRIPREVTSSLPNACALIHDR